MGYNYLPRLEEYNEIIHKKIHEGNYFTAFCSGQIPANSATYLYLQTPNDGMYVHAKLPEISITNDILKVIWRRGGTASGGTDINIVNNNDCCGNGNSMQIMKFGSTITILNAKLMKEYYIIGGNKTSATSRGNLEYILKSNTIYTLTLENIGNNSIFYSYEREWYEIDEMYPYPTPNKY
jgi:hypothetical protein